MDATGTPLRPRIVPFTSCGLTDKLILWIVGIFVIGSPGTATRPEDVLAKVITRPLVPVEGASTKCLEDSALYAKALENYIPWALQMYDASAKISPGIINGNTKQLSDYDECLRINTEHGFVGKSCTAVVQFEMMDGANKSDDLDAKDLILGMAKAAGLTNWTFGTALRYEWSWCVPSTCNYLEVCEALDLALNPIRVEGRINVAIDLNEDSCRTKESDRAVFDAADWIYISLLVLFSAAIVASTTYDLVKFGNRDERCKDTRDALLISFSLYTNGKNLLDTKRREESIACLDGLRFISICWIIYGHTYYFQVVGVESNTFSVLKMHENLSSLLVLNANIVTDTFFVLSGTLLTYTILSRKQDIFDQPLNVLMLYAQRYVRLTPAYAMTIGFYATIFYKLGSGPEWNTWVAVNRDYCRENWWTNLLYVNNYVKVGRMCMSQSWYLSMDMQLVWLSPIFLYPLLKFTRSLYFWIVLGIGFVISALVPFLITYYLKLTGTMLYYKNISDVAAVFIHIYTRTYARAGPYIVGLGMGNLLYKSRDWPRISTNIVICGWCVATATGLAVVFGPRNMYFDDHAYDRVEASFYAGLHRHVFALAVSWIIFASVNGCAGSVGRFLSWRGWMPLSKLTYSAYLCHYIVLLYNVGSARTAEYLTTYHAVHTYLGNLIIVMILSLVLSLCVEIPFTVLVRILMRGGRLRPEVNTRTTASEPDTNSNDSNDELPGEVIALRRVSATGSEMN